MGRKQTIAEIIAEPLVAIDSATGSGGLRERIGLHIDNPERIERAILTCECGWNHLAVSWAETPDRQSAAYYEAALLRSYFTRHRRMPSIGGLPAHDMAGTVPSEEGINNLTWSGLHAMVQENKPNIPESYGIYVISAGVPVNRSDWNLPQRGAVRGACPFATRHSPCRQGRGDEGGAARGHSGVSIPRPTFFDRDASSEVTWSASERKRPVVDLHGGEDHDWLHRVRRERRIREFIQEHGHEPTPQESMEWISEWRTKNKRRLEDFLE